MTEQVTSHHATGTCWYCGESLYIYVGDFEPCPTSWIICYFSKHILHYLVQIIAALAIEEKNPEIAPGFFVAFSNWQTLHRYYKTKYLYCRLYIAERLRESIMPTMVYQISNKIDSIKYFLANHIHRKCRCLLLLPINHALHYISVM